MSKESMSKVDQNSKLKIKIKINVEYSVNFHQSLQLWRNSDQRVD